MPENDPLESLDNFSEGLHVNAMPASEVRRRGDRMRRRNTALATVGGVVAAAVFIGTPVALLSGNDDDVVQPAPPAPTETQSPSGGRWLTEIPEDFPLADGFPGTNGSDGSPTEVVNAEPGDDSSSSVYYSSLCGVDWPAGPVLDRATIGYTGESEDFSDRALLLYDDDAAAQAMLEQLRTSVQDCPQEPTEGGDSVFENRLVGLDLGTEDSVVVSRQVLGDDGSPSQLQVTQVAQSGNALYVEQSYGSAGGQQAIELETQRLLDRSARPLGAMCLFSAEPCTITDDAATDPAPPAPSSDSAANPAIPADFPLDVDLALVAEGEKSGPDPDAEGVLLTELCATTAWPPADGVDRLAVRVTGPEYVMVRELVTFGSASEATAALAGVRTALAACPEAPASDPANDRTFTELEAEPGYEDAVTFGQIYREGTGGGVYQFIRVGNAVLATLAGGEYYLPPSLQAGADYLTEENLAVTDAMCLWTEAGC
jgi:hypothetical protein